MAPVKVESVNPINNPVPQEKTVAPVVAVDSVEGIVRAAARKYGISEDYFVSVAKCESTYNPGNVNYGYWEDQYGKAMGLGGVKYHPSGLFQHLTNYWPARATKYGYPGASVFNAEANANVTAAMFAEGHQRLWECK